MAPVLTSFWSVSVQVETQVCADPTLPTANGSGKIVKISVVGNIGSGAQT